MKYENFDWPTGQDDQDDTESKAWLLEDKALTLAEQLKDAPPEQIGTEVARLENTYKITMNTLANELAALEAQMAQLKEWFENDALEYVVRSLEDKTAPEFNIIEENIWDFKRFVDASIRAHHGQHLDTIIDADIPLRPKKKRRQHESLARFEFYGSMFLEELKNSVRLHLLDLEDFKKDTFKNLEFLYQVTKDIRSAFNAADFPQLKTALTSAKQCDKRHLQQMMALPMVQYDSVLEGSLDLAGDNVAAGADIIGDVMHSFDNEFEALHYLRALINKTTNNNSRAALERFADAFTGNFIPFENGDIINMNEIGYVQYSAQHLRIYNFDGYGTSYQITQSQAQTILDQLARCPSFAYVEGYAVNVNHVGYIRNSDDGLVFNGMSKSNEVPMDEQDRDDIKAQFAQLPSFREIGNYAVNINKIGYFYDDGQDIDLYRITGSCQGSITMEGDERKAALKKLAAEPSLIRAGDRYVVNADHVAYLYDFGYKLQFSNMDGYGPDPSLEESEREAILQQFRQRPNVVNTGEYLIDLGHVAYLYEYGNELRFRNMDGYGPDRYLEDSERKTIMNQFSQRPNVIQAGEYLINLDHIPYVYESVDELEFRNMDGYGPYQTLDKSARKMILDQIRQHPNFIQAGDHVVNLSQASRIHRWGKDVRFEDWHGKSFVAGIEDESASRALMAEIRRFGQRMRIAKQSYAYPDHFKYALLKAGEWERGAGPSIDTPYYMPFIMAAAMAHYDPESHKELIEDIDFADAEKRYRKNPYSSANALGDMFNLAVAQSEVMKNGVVKDLEEFQAWYQSVRKNISETLKEEFTAALKPATLAYEKMAVECNVAMPVDYSRSGWGSFTTGQDIEDMMFENIMPAKKNGLEKLPAKQQMPKAEL